MSVRTRQVIALVVIAPALLWAGAGEDIRALLTPDRAGCAHSSDLPEPGDTDEARAAVLCLLNHHRAEAGLPALVEDAALQAAAQAHAEDMGERDFYGHRNPDGADPRQRIRSAGFDGRATSENIHWGVGRHATVARIVDDWMASPGHRANILRAVFTRVGTGIGYDAPRRVRRRQPAVYVNNFGG